MTRTNWVLAALLAVQAILIAILWGRSPGASASKPLVPGFEPAKITRIELGVKSDAKLVLTKDASGWSMASADGFPADPAKVSKLLEAIRGITAGEPVVRSDRYHESLDITEEKARGRVMLFAGDGKQRIADIIVGSSASGGSHVRLAGKPEVFEAKDLSSWDAEPSKTSWMNRDVMKLSEADVVSLEVTNANGTFAIARDGEAWKVTSPENAKGRAVKKDKADELVRAAAGVSIDDAAGKLDEAAQGFSTPTAVVVIGVGGTEPVRLRVGGHPPDNAGKFYLAKDGFPFAVTVWESSVSMLTKAKIVELGE